MKKILVYLSIALLFLVIGYLLVPKLLTVGSRVPTMFTDQADVYDVVNNPTNLAAATSTLGSMIGTTTLYFKLTSLDYAGGQTEPSSEVSCELGPYLTGAPDGCIVTMTPAIGAETSRLWIGTSTDVYNYYQIATSSTFVGTTTGLTAGVIPTVNSAYLYNTIIDGAYLWERVTSDTLIKSGPAVLKSITYGPIDASSTAGKIEILNAITAGGGATSTTYYLTAAYHEPVTIVLDRYFSNGIYVDFTTTNDVDVSISYK